MCTPTTTTITTTAKSRSLAVLCLFSLVLCFQASPSASERISSNSNGNADKNTQDGSLNRRRRSWNSFTNFFSNIPCRMRHYKAVLDDQMNVVTCTQKCPRSYEEKYSLHYGHYCQFVEIPEGCSDRYCIRCLPGYYWMLGYSDKDRCVKKCPEGFYQDFQGRSCNRCTAIHCAECVGYSYLCKRCHEGFSLLNTLAGLPSYCLTGCPPGFKKKDVHGVNTCSRQQKTTAAPTTLPPTEPTTLPTKVTIPVTSPDCTRTVDGIPCSFPYVFKNKVYNGSCSEGHPRPWCAISTKPDGRYKRWGYCHDTCVKTACPISGCTACVRSKSTTFHIGCARCEQGLVLHRESFNDKCLASCPKGYYKTNKPGTNITVCSKCTSPFCAECSTQTTCISCHRPFLLDSVTGRCGLCPRGSDYDHQRKTCVTKDIKHLGGYGFGLSTPSYIGFNVDQKTFAESASFQVWFSSSQPNGVIMSAYGGPTEYEMIYLDQGKVVYTWSSGTHPVKIVSERTYTDGRWHKINTNRALRVGMLFMDNKVIDQGMSVNSSRVDNITNIYFGAPPHRSGAKDILPSEVYQFQGSMSDLKLYDMEIGSPSVENAVHDIYTRQEIKVGSEGGYMKEESLYDRHGNT